MSGSITETYRKIKAEFEAKSQILNYLRENEENRKKVEIYIKNEQLSLKVQPIDTGNIWGQISTYEQNIEKINKEISIYEKISSEYKDKGTRFKF